MCLNANEGKWILKNDFDIRINAINKNKETICLSLLDNKTMTPISYIFISNDNGNTWDTVFTHKRNFFDLGIKSLSVVSDDVIYAQGKDFKIFKTVNKGMKWDTLNVDSQKSDSRKLHFFDENIGVASWVSGSLYFTNNGGDNWESIFNESEKPAIWDVHIDNDTTIYFLARYIIDDTSQTRLYFTNNYGLEWDYHIVPNCHNITILDKSNLYIATDELVSDADEQRYSIIYYSSDNGETWNIKFKQNYGFNWGLSKIAFFDENNGIAVGAYGLIFRTIDAGESWTRELFDTPYFHLHQLGSPISNILMMDKHNALLTYPPNKIFMAYSETHVASSIQNQSYIFPNPSSNSINISDIEYIGQYQIYNSIGQSVDSGYSNNNQVQVNNLQPGVYFLKASSNARFFTFIKE
jgi:hypothetical protein